MIHTIVVALALVSALLLLLILPLLLGQLHSTRSFICQALLREGNSVMSERERVVKMKSKALVLALARMRLASWLKSESSGVTPTPMNTTYSWRYTTCSSP